jgi:MFS family permease
MKRRLFVILNLSVVSGFVILGISIVSPVLPQYALSFSIPVALIGWAVSAFALARLFMDVPAGFLADRFGRKINMIAGLILIILSSVGAGLATSYPLLILARIVEGVGSALYVTSATTWVAQISAGESRGRYMSLYSALIFAGTSFGPTIGGYSAVHFGLKAPIFIYAAFAFFERRPWRFTERTVPLSQLLRLCPLFPQSRRSFHASPALCLPESRPLRGQNRGNHDGSGYYHFCTRFPFRVALG